MCFRTRCPSLGGKPINRAAPDTTLLTCFISSNAGVLDAFLAHVSAHFGVQHHCVATSTSLQILHRSVRAAVTANVENKMDAEATEKTAHR
jgi:hypothetical protein